MNKLFLFLILLLPFKIIAAEKLVTTNSQLNEAIKNAKPGDIIVMKNGIWNNAEILFQAKGTKEKTIILKAQTKGKVTLEGASNLRIAGEYLTVEGLVFKNGFSPTPEVISFRKDAKTLANHCRLTEVVIDNYNVSERYDVQAWTVLYGKNNRVDHCSFLNKRTQGVTLIVRLNTPESVENNHLIDHNYFGPRQNLGSNGGETLRIGTSHYSMMNSKTLVEFNYFDRCDGEHEIISNKSNQNTYKYNTFFECKGTLTMRHGNETHVEGNVFFGNGVANTGGIRVINEKQTVINNYVEGLTGNRFRGALTVMNGVPNSPLNRYVSVKESVIDGNSIINCDHVELCAGSDKERSAVPQTTSLSRNLFVSNSSKMFGIFDDISGLKFDNNILSNAIEQPSKKGFTNQNVILERNNKGLLVPKGKDLGAGATIEDFADRENTGVKWYKTDVNEIAFDSGVKTEVASGVNTLYEAINKSKPGDVLILKEGLYNTTKNIEIPHTLSIISNGKTNLLFETKSLFTIVNGGSLKLKGLHIDGEEAPDGPLNSVIATSKYSMNKNYKLIIEDCEFVNLDVNNYFNVLRVSASTFADTIAIKNSKFETISGAVLALERELDDIGIYNAEAVIIENCSFKNIEGAAFDLYRGGSDESTTAGFFKVDHCYFENIGLSSKNKSKSSINLYGIQNAIIKNSIFKKTAPFNFILTVGEPINALEHNFIEKSQIINVKGEGYNSNHNSESTTIGGDAKPVGTL